MTCYEYKVQRMTVSNVILAYKTILPTSEDYAFSLENIQTKSFAY